MARNESGWEVILEPLAEKDLDQLRGAVRRDAIATLKTLPFEPYLGEPMRRYKNLYRVYFGNDRFRLIYAVDQRRKQITVTKMQSRDKVYKGLRNPQ